MGEIIKTSRVLSVEAALMMAKEGDEIWVDGNAAPEAVKLEKLKGLTLRGAEGSSWLMKSMKVVDCEGIVLEGLWTGDGGLGKEQLVVQRSGVVLRNCKIRGRSHTAQEYEDLKKNDPKASVWDVSLTDSRVEVLGGEFGVEGWSCNVYSAKGNLEIENASVNGVVGSTESVWASREVDFNLRFGIKTSSFARSKWNLQSCRVKIGAQLKICTSTEVKMSGGGLSYLSTEKNGLGCLIEAGG